MEKGEYGAEEQEHEEEDENRHRGRARLHSPDSLAAPEAAASRSLLAEAVSRPTDTSTITPDVDDPSPTDSSANPSADTSYDLSV